MSYTYTISLVSKDGQETTPVELSEITPKTEGARPYWAIPTSVKDGKPGWYKNAAVSVSPVFKELPIKVRIREMRNGQEAAITTVNLDSGFTNAGKAKPCARANQVRVINGHDRSVHVLISEGEDQWNVNVKVGNVGRTSGSSVKSDLFKIA
jgi:hypothetical protein